MGAVAGEQAGENLLACIDLPGARVSHTQQVERGGIGRFFQREASADQEPLAPVLRKHNRWRAG